MFGRGKGIGRGKKKVVTKTTPKPPTRISVTTLKVDKNTPVGTVIGTIQSDGDGPVTYSIIEA